MAEVGLGRAGIVLGLEVSRLARNSIDWHRLLEVCALTDTLILDEDGVYSPRDYNDRLLLGLKGAMSEAELHVLKARMQGGILNQARRGALKQHLPTGFVYDQNRQVMRDPDAQVRDTIVHLFVTFERTGSACAVVRHFRDRAMKFPHRQGHGYRLGALRWQALTVSRTRDILHNPRYAGAFAYGRTRRVHQAQNRLTIARVPVEDWKALVRDVHAGYITWDQYESNLRQLRDNHRGSVPPGPPREGAALLQGIVLCGLCGTHMLTRYRPGKHAPRAEYFCNGRLDHTAAPRCQSIPGAFIDRAIGVLLIELVEPVALETALSVHEELQARNDEVAALREQAVQRAREAAELARRRYMETDPGNRLVADVLEAQWENGLRAVREAEEERDRRRAEDRLAVGDDARRRILALATDFPRLWNDPATPNRERKRMARGLLEDITLTRGTRAVLAGIRLRGGQTRQLCVPFDRDTNPRKHRAPIIAEIEELLVQQPEPRNQPLPQEVKQRHNHPGRDPKAAPVSGSINPNMGGSIRAVSDSNPVFSEVPHSVPRGRVGSGARAAPIWPGTRTFPKAVQASFRRGRRIAKIISCLRGGPAPDHERLDRIVIWEVVRVAEGWSLVPEGCNPCRSVVEYPERKRERFLTAEVFTKLGKVLEEVETRGGAAASAVAALRLLMLTGCRRSQINTCSP